MFKLVTNLPISRRLFIAFALAALLPSLVSGLIGFYLVTQRGGRVGPVTLMAQAQGNITPITNNLTEIDNQMEDLRTLLFNGNTAFAFTQGTGPTFPRPNMPPNINQQAGHIHTLAQSLTQGFASYNQQYNPTNANMSQVKAAIDQNHPDELTVMSANSLLNQIVKTDWPAYVKQEQTVIDTLQRDLPPVNTLASETPTASNTKSLQNAVRTLASSYFPENNTLGTDFTTISKDWNQLSGYINKISGYVNLSDGNNITPILLGSVGVFLAISVLIIFIGYAVQKSITTPLTELITLTKRISKGDTNARVAVGGHDEISIVGNAMNNMLDNIVHLIQETQSQRDDLQGQVEKLVSEVSGVGEGDLRVTAEVTADALGVLADSFNYMVEELGSLVVRVKMVAREVEESTTMTSDRMSELVETADRQIQQIANAAQEIERMAQNSQQVANRSMGLSSSAREARISAQGGRQAVQQTIEGMGRISLNVQETSQKVQSLGESSREINNIVEAISTIAHQTNRLALDAAIQAAMAGDNGKGFGAVAADIRRLAERAKEQATSVGRIVRGVRDEIDAVAVSMRDTERETATGAHLAEEAGSSLESIFSVVERQAREIDVINQMAMQQQQSSNNVVQIMQGVSESTQESSGSTREAAQNMERIARLAEQLLASVEAFKLRESLNYFTPNTTNRSEEEGILTLSGAFRTVTATVQPISNGNNSYVGLPAPNAENGASQFSPAFFSQGSSNNQQPFPPLKPHNGQQYFAPQGQQAPYNNQEAFTLQGANNGQQSFATPGPNNGQQFFSPQGLQGQYPSQEAFPPQGQYPGQQPFTASKPNNNQQFFFPSPSAPNGQQPFPPQGANGGNSGQPLPPFQGPSNAQYPFPAQGNRGANEPQWPDPQKDWQASPSNW